MIRRKWSRTEDAVLITAWLNTPKDPGVGSEQKVGAFWKRVADCYAASPTLAGLQPREPSHCKQRWQKINKGVCEFVSCYEAATKERSNLQNENEVMKAAHEIYYRDYKVKFNLEHAWRELRYDQKWCESSSSKRRKCDDQSAQSSTYVPGSHGEDEAMARSHGVKAAAKAKVKKAVSKPTTVEEGSKELVEYQSKWEITQKEFVLKEKLSKHKMLDSLLAKTEPLSELETALKNKLITDILAS